MPDGEPSQSPAWLANAGQAVGLVAGVVALGYLLGAGVIAVRLFMDKFAPDEVAGVIGELPREFVITLGFIEGLAIAASVGLLLALLAVLAEWPSKTTKPAAAGWSAALFAVACFIFIIVFEGGWRRQMWILVPLLLMSLAAGAAGAAALARAGQAERSERSRGALCFLVVTAVGIPLCVMFGPIVGFPDARVCLRDSEEPLTGSLVADTPDSVVLLRQPQAQREEATLRTVDTVPSDLVARLDFGDLSGLPDCTPPRAAAPAGSR